MNRKKALSLIDELMSNFSTVILEEDFDAESEDSWEVSVAESSFYNDKLEYVNKFAKKHNLCYVIKTNTLKFFEDDSESDNDKATEKAQL